MNPTLTADEAALPIARFEQVHTSDLDEARSIVGSAFCPHMLVPTDTEGTAPIRFHSATAGKIGLHYLDYGTDMCIRPRELDDFYLIQIPLSGVAEIKWGAETFESTPAVASILQPGGPIAMQWHEGNRQLIVRVDRQNMERQLQEALGAPLREPLRFDIQLELNRPGVRSWRGVLELLRTEMENGGSLPDDPIVMKEFERLLLSQLIVAQPNNYSEALQRSVAAAPRTIRRAVEILEHHADETLTVEDVASATGISVRALQDGFRKYYGTTPMGYLREVRMKAVRAWLLQADPSTTTVSDAAARCGFVHLGRFSVQYREKFGETPSATLRR
ncbi:AraC family transcriptional regulator [Rhodococcus tibetensis]|uniref:AraC family transcriptional regulator n=1 Tax=Rhodococcus tibetensis TaxID=2965064 RepID=A0ABT1Q840_9NOCA|nr:AraC family transcriptional regulator [Rhodococcus sp. FXJ9.536]MCQ4118413.1 AraC family transcriptional regulator [Rhodococcus sp. FXJ9.536]